MYELVIVVLLALLAMYAYRFLQQKSSAVTRNYDVFLSFRGRDTHTGFADFLYKSLVDAGVHVFRDNETIPVGEEIGSELHQAIKTCKIAIPIISEQYAESKWCLRELTEIMYWHEKHGKLVFPVFYNVYVDDVSFQRGNFRKSLRQHKMLCSAEEVLQWQKALISVTAIGGWTTRTIANGHEGELVKMMVAKVRSELKTTWIERLPMFPLLMSNDYIRSVYLYFSKKKRRESKWQVFLAFRGCDTRNGFAAYLSISLAAQGINVFRHDDPSLIGKNLSCEIRNAIDHCKISIPILSENYGSSSWCLDELYRMVECKKKTGQKMMPIFYKVKTSHLKEISHHFGECMLRRKLVDESTYEQWKHALEEVGSTKGWVSEAIANGHEGELVTVIVKAVSKMLKNP